MEHGQLQGGAAAERVADDDRAVDPGRVQRVAQVVAQDVRLCRLRRLAESAHVDAQHPVVAGQVLEDPVPHPAVADAGVDEQQAGAFAGNLVGQHVHDAAPTLSSR